MNNEFNSFQNYSWKGIIFIQEVYNTVKVTENKIIYLNLARWTQEIFLKIKR